jgi:hypothetical protein
MKNIPQKLLLLCPLKMHEHVKRIFLFAHMPVDFEEIQLNSKDPTNEALENAIVAIERNGIALKVLYLQGIWELKRNEANSGLCEFSGQHRDKI